MRLLADDAYFEELELVEAELMVAEIISLSRRLTEQSAQMHKGIWTKVGTLYFTN